MPPKEDEEQPSFIQALIDQNKQTEDGQNGAQDNNLYSQIQKIQKAQRIQEMQKT